MASPLSLADAADQAAQQAAPQPPASLSSAVDRIASQPPTELSLSAAVDGASAPDTGSRNNPQPGDKPSPDLWTAVQVAAERMFSQPVGQAGAAFKVGFAQPGFGQGGAYNDLAQSFKLMFPRLSGGPSIGQIENFAQSNPKFQPVWDTIKQQQRSSQEAARARGPNPDWDQIESDHLNAVYNEVESRWANGERPSPDNPLPDPRDTQAMIAYAQAKAVPGLDEPPLTDQQVARTAFAAISARSAQDVAALPWWIRASINAAITGLEFGTLARFIPGEGALSAMGQNVAYEAANQGLGLASGAQSELQPGQAFLSTAIMGAASRFGEAAAAAFPKASEAARTAAGVGAQIGTFEAAGVAQKGLEALTTHDRLAPDDNRTEWEKLGDFAQAAAENLITTGVTAGVAGAVAGIGKPSEPATAEGRPDLAQDTDLSAAQKTMAALKRTLKGIVGIDTAGKEQAAAREKQINAEFLPAEVAVEKAVQNYNDAADKAAGGDEALRATIDDVTLKAVESEGRIPVPEDFPLPNELPQLVALRREIGAAGLDIGRLLNKYKALPDARYQMPGTTSDIVIPAGSNEQPPPGAQLVGGLKFHEERGFYFPQIQKTAETPEGVGLPPRAPPAGPKPPAVETPLAAGHLMKRTMSTEEAFSKRPLDTSVDAGYRVLIDEARMGKSAAFYELARADKQLLTKDELPDAGQRAQMLNRAKQLDDQIKQKRAENKLFSGPDQARGLLEIAALLKQKGELENAARENFFKELKGKQYGKYEGMFIHPDALAAARQLRPDPSALGYVFRAMSSAFKWVREGFNVSLWLDHFVRNGDMYAGAGINTLPEEAHATGVMLKKRAQDDLDHEFIAQARRASFGGVSEITKGDVAAPLRLRQKLEEAEKAGQSTTALKLARAIYERGKLMEKLPAALRKPLELFAQIPRLQMALTDNAQALAAYRVLRTKGAGGSGPMSAVDAFDYVRGVSDLSTLGPGTQMASNVLSFIRRPAKAVQAMLNRQMLLRPTIMGTPIPTALDAVIESSPGSPQAQAALAARGMLRIGTTAAHWLLPIKGVQMAAANALGITQQELDKDLKDKFSYLPAPTAWLSRQVFIPTGRTKDGDITGVDAGKYIAAIRAMRYFSPPESVFSLFANKDHAINPKSVNDLAFEIANKNIFAGPIANAATSQNFMGKPVAKGFGPGQQYWPVESMVMPGFPFRSLDEYSAQQNLPPEERSVMRNLVKTVVGIPTTVLNKQDFTDREIQRLYNEGTIGVAKQDDGKWYYYVSHPDTAEGYYANLLLQQNKDMPTSLSRMTRAQYRAVQDLLDRMGQK